MAKYEFKVGDRVQFKEWDEMGKEFGLRTDGINTKCLFRKEMRHFCGTYATIENLTSFAGHPLVVLRDFTTTGNTRWNFTPDMLKPASTKKQKADNENSKPNGEDKPITYPTITAHLIEGNKTTVMLSDGRIGEVTCYYKDTFDPAVGLAEAYKKAIGINKAEDKPKPKFEVGKKYVVGLTLPSWVNNGEIIVIDGSSWNGKYYSHSYTIHGATRVFDEDSDFGKHLTSYTEPEVKEVKRMAKVGEYIKLTKDASNPFSSEKFRKGEIILIKDFGCLPGIKLSSGDYLGFTSDEYVVLEGYDPDIHGKI